MIVLFTDYGMAGPYIGQVEACLHRYAAEETVINLFADAPRNDPRASAYLLAAYTRNFSSGTVFFCVVDPGVGSFEHKPVILRVDGRWYVGPDNGLFDILVRQSDEVASWEILWRPEQLSNSFHGRDLYAPVCAYLATGREIQKRSLQWQDQHQWPGDLDEVIYIDHFGNAITGRRADTLSKASVLKKDTFRIKHASTFSRVQPEHAFWYENSNGLLEIAVNLGSAAEQLGCKIGTMFDVQEV